MIAFSVSVDGQKLAMQMTLLEMALLSWISVA